MERKKEKNNLRWWILITVIVGTFLGRLDQMVVNLALPKIISDFGITVSAAGWIATAYILANAIFVPIWGKLGDTLGQKKIYLVGFSLFIFGSTLAGMAWNLTSMIIFRIIQAIAGSADYPTAMAIIALTFRSSKERAQALGLWSASFASAAVFSPIIGGPLIDNFGWRSVFFMNIPVGIVGILMAMTFIKESPQVKYVTNFDWWGSIILGISLTSFVLVLDKGLSWGWTSLASVSCYLLTLIAGFIFIKIENKSNDPIVDLSFFKNPTFTAVIINTSIVFMSLMGAIFLIPIFAETYLGYDATKTGFLFVPMAFMMMIAAPLGGSLTGKIKARYVVGTSTVVAGIGLYFFSFLDPRSSAWAIIIPLSIMAFGLGFGMAQRTNIVASSVPEKEVGGASSVLALTRNIAGAFGIAVFSTILQNSQNSSILKISQNSFIQIKSPINLKEYIALMSLKAQIMSYDKVFIIASVIAFLGTLTVYWIREKEEVKVGVN